MSWLSDLLNKSKKHKMNVSNSTVMKNGKKLIRVATVNFENSTKKYFYLCPLDNVGRADFVEVEAGEEIKIAKVAEVVHYQSTPYPMKKMKVVIRKTTKPAQWKSGHKHYHCEHRHTEPAGDGDRCIDCGKYWGDDYSWVNYSLGNDYSLDD